MPRYIPYNERPVEDIIDEKFASTEIYFIKEISRQIALNVILNKQMYIKNDKELRRVILQFLIDNEKRFKIGTTPLLMDEVMYYMNHNPGRLGIKEFLLQQEEKVKEKQKKESSSLDELFGWTIDKKK